MHPLDHPRVDCIPDIFPRHTHPKRPIKHRRNHFPEVITTLGHSCHPSRSLRHNPLIQIAIPEGDYRSSILHASHIAPGRSHCIAGLLHSNAVSKLILRRRSVHTNHSFPVEPPIREVKDECRTSILINARGTYKNSTAAVPLKKPVNGGTESVPPPFPYPDPSLTESIPADPDKTAPQYHRHSN